MSIHPLPSTLPEIHIPGMELVPSLALTEEMAHNLILSLHSGLFAPEYGIWLWEPLENSLSFNAMYLAMLGYPEKSFPYTIDTWRSLTHPEDVPVIEAHEARFILSAAEGDSFESTFRMRHADGHYIGVLSKSFVLCRNEQGQATHVVGIQIDLTVLDQKLKGMLKQHDRMRFALEAAKDGLWDWDPQSNEVYFSPRYIAMLGYTEDQYPPRAESWALRVHPADRAATVEMQVEFAASPQHGDCFECMYRFLAADGTYKWLLGRGKVTRRDASGKATRIVGLHTDISELRNTQEALAQLINHDALTHLHSRFYFEQALHNMGEKEHPVSIIYADIDCLKLVNDYLGHQAGDKLLTTAADLLRTAMRATDIAARIGGDEFILVLPRCPEKVARNILQKIYTALDKHNAQPDAVPLFISLGLVSTGKQKVQDAMHKLIAQADKHMLEDKKRHRPQHLIAVKNWIEHQLQSCVDCEDCRL